MRTLTIQLTDQAHSMLQELEQRGIYGHSPQQIVERMIDNTLIERAEAPLLKLSTEMT